ncbi:MAG: recombination mediator RecR [Bacteroidota bacterium]|nr:recombination mediator RecR [Bacteroidota bacterium]
MQIPETLQNAVDELSKLPGIGKKTAFRLALNILKSDDDKVKSLVLALEGLKSKLHLCKNCFNLSEDDECDICRSNKRDKSIICVVEEVSDVIAIEKTNEYSGTYHVLGGVLNPLMGVTPESLKINELMVRLNNITIKEVILALNPDTEGETTALYLAKRIKEMDIKVTRIARGLPIGGDLEFADEATVGRAVLGRIVI